MRAEKAAAKFGKARQPIVLEFAGVPKAGKTTTLGALQSFLKRCGFRVEIVVERASVCPIRDKQHANFNVWTVCTTLAQILEKTQNPPRADDPHVLILDRGLFDSLCWLTLMEHLERIRQHERDAIEKFLMIGDWRKRISAVFVMTVKPEEAMLREQGLLPVDGAKGSIMNNKVLEQMLNTTREMTKRLQKDFRIFEIDTSGSVNGKPDRNGSKQTAEKVADIALNIIEEHLQEDILCIHKTEIDSAFSRGSFIERAEAQKLIDQFNTRGRFIAREEAEKDQTVVQALPIVVIRNRSGEVLRLRRKERDSENPLNDKIVIWAGGHTRKEDRANGDTLLQCVVRELQEELRLSLEPHEFDLKGAIYIGLNERSAKHVAIAYEWRAKTDDVAVVLSTAEFFERKGTSLSGTFISLRDLALEVDNEKITEEWSVKIVREILAKGQSNFSPDLPNLL
jgi:predicted NUDIX family phosphoesterase